MKNQIKIEPTNEESKKSFSETWQQFIELLQDGKKQFETEAETSAFEKGFEAGLAGCLNSGFILNTEKLFILTLNDTKKQ